MKLRWRKTYRVFVFRYIFVLTAILLLIFGAYTYYNYQRQYQDKTLRKIENTSSRIVQQVDERFNNLKQYYITRADNDSVKWFLENSLKYSDYSSYKAVYDDMGSEGIFTDYWRGFALVNFKTGWVLSNKGVFQLYEAYNRDILMSIYEQKLNSIEKYYWLYDEKTNVNVDTLDREYRVTVETGGLNFVMRLPANSYDTYGLFVANINLDTWEKWINELLEDDDELVVLDSNGELVYASNEALTNGCRSLLESGDTEGRLKGGNGDYMVASAQSGILGWNYYVLYNAEIGREAVAVSLVIFCLLLLWVFVGVFLVSRLIYSPVDNLVKNVIEVNGSENGVVGNELDYLAGSYKNLKDDKTALEGLLSQQQDKLEELFELRLIRGEVNSDELNEYVEGFGLKQYKYYETVVVILKLGDEESTNTVNDDAICLKLLQEMPREFVKMAWLPPVYNAGAVFAIFADDEEETLLSKVKDFNLGMSRYVEETYSYQILMGVSATHENYKHIRAAYRESINAMTSDGGDNECYFYLSKVSEHDNNYNGSFEHDIKAAVNNMDKEACYRVIDEFSVFLRDNVSGDMIPIYAVRLADAILLSAVSTHVNLEQAYPEGVNKIYRELVQVNEHGRIRRYLKSQLIDPLLLERKKRLEDNSYMIMDQIEKKIAESKGNISVTECADALGVSTSYIWKVLKMESGKSFSDYQDEYKLEEAKRLLLETDMSVVEIAAELNYTNAQNFIRFFSKKTGITPGKFRKL